jgi:hypothetical protein
VTGEVWAPVRPSYVKASAIEGDEPACGLRYVIPDSDQSLQGVGRGGHAPRAVIARVAVLLDVDATVPARNDAAVNDGRALAVRVRDGAEHPLEFGEDRWIVDAPVGRPEDFQATPEGQDDVVVVESPGATAGDHLVLARRDVDSSRCDLA